MTEKTKIEWATHSFSPWLGCSRVHTGCVNCYAEAMAGRLGVTWGANGTRRRTAESTWKQVERWNRQAACTCHPERGTCDPCLNGPPRVFPSLCDPFEMWSGVIRDSKGLTMHTPDGQQYLTMDDVRRDFFDLIDRCQNLDFLLLTKRTENIRQMWQGRIECSQCGKPQEYGDGTGRCSWHACTPTGSCDGEQLFQRRSNVWLLYSASDQASLEAGLTHLLACRDLSPVLGLSLEPLIGPIDLPAQVMDRDRYRSQTLDWVIVGGESGPRHRPMCLSWLKSIADQCSAADVPLFVKQDCGPKAGQQGRIPNHLWTRKEFPRVSNQP